MKRVLYISVLTLFLAIGCEKDEPKIDKSIIGSWSIIQVDSCNWPSYYGADTTRTTIISNSGYLNFYRNRLGFIDSNKDFFCGTNEFEWYYYSGEIELKTDYFVSESSVTVLGQDSISFIIEDCTYRIGELIWYEITLKKDI